MRSRKSINPRTKLKAYLYFSGIYTFRASGTLIPVSVWFISIRTQITLKKENIKDILSIDEESANEQQKFKQTINFIGQNNKLNCTQFSEDYRVFFLDFFPLRRQL